jgi:hypothetical protein
MNLLRPLALSRGYNPPARCVCHIGLVQFSPYAFVARIWSWVITIQLSYLPDSQRYEFVMLTFKWTLLQEMTLNLTISIIEILDVIDMEFRICRMNGQQQRRPGKSEYRQCSTFIHILDLRTPIMS